MSDEAPQEGVVSAHSDAEGILIVRVFDAPRELVFKAWTEAERFATWFGEHGSTHPVGQGVDGPPAGRRVERHHDLRAGRDRARVLRDASWRSWNRSASS